MFTLIHFIRRGTDLKSEWSFYDQYWLNTTNLPTANHATAGWCPPQLWGAEEDGWGISRGLAMCSHLKTASKVGDLSSTIVMAAHCSGALAQVRAIGHCISACKRSFCTPKIDLIYLFNQILLGPIL